MRAYTEIISKKTHYFDSSESYTTELGVLLPSVRVAYRTWGTLNSQKDNVILICQALTGSADADAWWEGMFSRGGAFDETTDFIICSNVLGSCYGTTGPLSLNPLTGSHYGPDFPLITIRDMVHVQRLLLAGLGIDRVKLAVGASLGGMQVLEWGFLYPDVVQALMPMGASGRHSAWCIGQSEAQRQAIYADRDWNNGWYDQSHPPARGLSAARMMAMCTYRSFENFQSRFSREVQSGKGTFKVESYLHHQEESWSSGLMPIHILRLLKLWICTISVGAGECMKRFFVPCRYLLRYSRSTPISSIQKRNRKSWRG